MCKMVDVNKKAIRIAILITKKQVLTENHKNKTQKQAKRDSHCDCPFLCMVKFDSLSLVDVMTLFCVIFKNITACQSSAPASISILSFGLSGLLSPCLTNNIVTKLNATKIVP